MLFLALFSLKDAGLNIETNKEFLKEQEFPVINKTITNTSFIVRKYA